jgi:hypothetical protein
MFDVPAHPRVDHGLNPTALPATNTPKERTMLAMNLGLHLFPHSMASAPEAMKLRLYWILENRKASAQQVGKKKLDNDRTQSM